MKWWPSTVNAGDMLRVKLGSIYHYGIAVSDSEVVQFGMPPLPAYRDGGEIVVLKTDIDVFACGNIVEVLLLDKKEAKTRIPPSKTVQIALSRLGEGGYNLLHNNCEHFANECFFGVHRSTIEELAVNRWRSRTILDVYFAPIPEVLPSFVITDKARGAYISDCTSMQLKNSRIYDWYVLDFAARRSLGIEISSLAFKQKHGKWTAKGIEFSLSHTDNAVAVAVSNNPCGVDIELLNRFSRYGDLQSMADRSYSDAEKSALAVDAGTFAHVWTAKESIFKLKGDKSFVPSKITTIGAQTATVDYKGYVLTVAGDNAAKAHFFDFDGSKASLVL